MPESAEKCRISLRISTVNQLSLRRRGLDGNFQESQAAATAEIFGTAITTAAGLGHPRLAPEFLECTGLLPNPFERMLANIVEGEFGNHTGCVTGERPA